MAVDPFKVPKVVNLDDLFAPLVREPHIKRTGRVIDLEVHITCRETQQHFVGQLIGEDLFCGELPGDAVNAIERLIRHGMPNGVALVPDKIQPKVPKGKRFMKNAGRKKAKGKNYYFRVIFP